MKQIIIITIALIYFGRLTAQQSQIELQTIYGSEHKEISEILRFEGIEIIDLHFSGNNLKGKDYTILIKEFVNGSLSNIDTLVNSKMNKYLQPIDTTSFKFKFFVKTQLNNTIKMITVFKSFSIEKIYKIKQPKDQYALHDFLNNNMPLQIEIGKPTYILGYFLPYFEKETGWKKYCEVSGSKYSPEEWGKIFYIPNYFLVEVTFELE